MSDELHHEHNEHEMTAPALHDRQQTVAYYIDNSSS